MSEQQAFSREQIMRMIAGIDEQLAQLNEVKEHVDSMIQENQKIANQPVDLKKLNFEQRADLEGYVHEVLPEASLEDLNLTRKLETHHSDTTASKKKAVKIRDNV